MYLKGILTCKIVTNSFLLNYGYFLIPASNQNNFIYSPLTRGEDKNTLFLEPKFLLGDIELLHNSALFSKIREYKKTF